MNKLVSLIFLLLITFNGISQKDGFVKSADSALIYYRTYGSGQPLLIINGGPGMNSNGFEQLATILSKKYQTIIYDQRGTGKSKLPVLDSSTITMKLMLDDMEALRKHFGIKKWSLLGHSFGGIVASYYATRYPQNIERIILSSSGGIDLELLSYVQSSINSKLTREEQEAMRYWTQKINDGDTTYHARLERGKALAPAYIYNKKFVPQLAVRLTQGNSTINGLMWDDLRKINYNCAKGLSSFNKPVLIIQGKEDIIKAETGEKAHAVLKHSKLVLMEHCGHYGWLDNEAVYFKEIDSFMAVK
jgi:proline iminopeptidase